MSVSGPSVCRIQMTYILVSNESVQSCSVSLMFFHLRVQVECETFVARSHEEIPQVEIIGFTNCLGLAAMPGSQPNVRAGNSDVGV